MVAYAVVLQDAEVVEHAGVVVDTEGDIVAAEGGEGTPKKELKIYIE